MAKPTASELIRQLELDTVSHEVQLEHITVQVAAIGADLKEINRTVHDIRRDVAVLQSENATTSKELEQIKSRRWSVLLAIISAAIGAAFTFTVQLSLKALSK